MNNNLLIILFIVFNLFLVWKVTSYFNDNVYVTSTVDNQSYFVRNTTSNKVEVANQLAIINNRITSLINILNTKYSGNSDYFYIKYLGNYKTQNMSEASIDKRYTTYTVNKEDLFVCLRTRDANEHLYDINILMYVIIHELAHFCNYDIRGTPIEGHGVEFREKFIFLLKEAISAGLYVYEDYSLRPKEYCGLSVNSNILN
jgi:hypothetical protein